MLPPPQPSTCRRSAHGVGGFFAGADPFHAGEHTQAGHLHRARDGAAALDRRDGVRFAVALFFFGGALFDAEQAFLVVAPGHHLAVGQQRVVAGAAGRDMPDVFETGDFGGAVAGHEHSWFGLAGGPFPALFAGPSLAEFRGPPVETVPL